LAFPIIRTPVFYLLGLMHGHWNLAAEQIDELSSDVAGGEPLIGLGQMAQAEFACVVFGFFWNPNNGILGQAA
jgi:hypothetical protein